MDQEAAMASEKEQRLTQVILEKMKDDNAQALAAQNEQMQLTIAQLTAGVDADKQANDQRFQQYQAHVQQQFERMTQWLEMQHEARMTSAQQEHEAEVARIGAKAQKLAEGGSVQAKRPRAVIKRDAKGDMESIEFVE